MARLQDARILARAQAEEVVRHLHLGEAQRDAAAVDAAREADEGAVLQRGRAPRHRAVEGARPVLQVVLVPAGSTAAPIGDFGRGARGKFQVGTALGTAGPKPH